MSIENNSTKGYRASYRGRVVGPWRKTRREAVLDEGTAEVGNGYILAGYTASGRVRVENEDGVFLFTAKSPKNAVKRVLERINRRLIMNGQHRMNTRPTCGFVQNAS